MKRIRFFVILITVITFALMGSAYAYWTDMVAVEGTANTGHMDVVIIEARAANLDGSSIGGNVSVPYVYSGQNNGHISPDGKSATMSVENIYPSAQNMYQNFQIRIQNNSSIPVKLDNVTFEILPGSTNSDLVWDYLMARIYSLHIEQPLGIRVKDIGSASPFHFRDLEGVIDGLLAGVIIEPDQILRFSGIGYWLDPEAVDETQNEEIAFKLTFNWVQWNLQGGNTGD